MAQNGHISANGGNILSNELIPSKCFLVWLFAQWNNRSARWQSKIDFSTAKWNFHFGHLRREVSDCLRTISTALFRGGGKITLPPPALDSRLEVLIALHMPYIHMNESGQKWHFWFEWHLKTVMVPIMLSEEWLYVIRILFAIYDVKYKTLKTSIITLRI